MKSFRIAMMKKLRIGISKMIHDPQLRGLADSPEAKMRSKKASHISHCCPMPVINPCNLEARPERLLNYGLKCPGPRRVVNGLVIGEQVCPHGVTLSLETGVFWKPSGQDKIYLKTRCGTCNGRFMFNEFLRTHFLERDAAQIQCSHNECFNPTWEGTKFCQDHFYCWRPDVLDLIGDDIEELRYLFKKAADSQQWSPMTEITAKAIKRIQKNGEADIPASRIVNIDLEFGPSTRKVLQIGLTNMREDRVLDCLTTYSKGITASPSNRSVPPSRAQIRYEEMVRNFFSHDGTLGSNEVVEKLRESGISQNTIFMSWASWCFDLSYLRDWLEAEGFHGVLPGDENVCLILMDFRRGLEKYLGTTCFRGRRFPLSLPLVFPLLFGLDHPLSGKNHHALVDAKQLTLMVKLYVDLCRPRDERVFWPTLDIAKLGPRMRQGPLEEYFPPSKKPRISKGDE